MNKKMLVTVGFSVTALAALIALVTAIGAESPNTIARASSSVGILGLLGVGSFMFAWISKD